MNEDFWKQSSIFINHEPNTLLHQNKIDTYKKIFKKNILQG